MRVWTKQIPNPMQTTTIARILIRCANLSEYLSVSKFLAKLFNQQANFGRSFELAKCCITFEQIALSCEIIAEIQQRKDAHFLTQIQNIKGLEYLGFARYGRNLVQGEYFDNAHKQMRKLDVSDRKIPTFEQFRTKCIKDPNYCAGLAASFCGEFNLLNQKYF